MSYNSSFNNLPSLTSNIYSTFTNPLVILSILVLIIIVIVITNVFDFDLGYSGRSTNNGAFGYGSSYSSSYYGNEESSVLSYFTYFILFILFLILLYYAIYYLFGIDLYKLLMNFFYPQPTPYNPAVSYVPNYLTNKGSSTIPTTTSTPLPSQEVYNVPGNYYTYDDANAVCKAFGGRLAKYKEVEDAYNNGGEWCNYGWSDEQMALFPTQQSTYDALQKKKGSEHNCGRPGVNGGYLANPSIKFGANCYGVKPQINSQEQQNMQNVSSTPITQDDINFQNKVNFWKDKLDSIILAPFNYNEWSVTQNITNLTTSPNPIQTTVPIQDTHIPTITQTTAPIKQNSITYPIATNTNSTNPSPNITVSKTLSNTQPTQSVTPSLTPPTGNTATVSYPSPSSESTSMTSPPNSSWWSTILTYLIPSYYTNTTITTQPISTPFVSNSTPAFLPKTTSPPQ